jgi:hypothetical protein
VDHFVETTRVILSGELENEREVDHVIEALRADIGAGAGAPVAPSKALISIGRKVKKDNKSRRSRK